MKEFIQAFEELPISKFVMCLIGVQTGAAAIVVAQYLTKTLTGA